MTFTVKQGMPAVCLFLLLYREDDRRDMIPFGYRARRQRESADGLVFAGCCMRIVDAGSLLFVGDGQLVDIYPKTRGHGI